MSYPRVRATISHYGNRTYAGGLIINTTDEIDVSSYIDGDFGAEVSYSRDGISGVMIGMSFPQVFYKNARKFLLDLYMQYKHFAYARLNIYHRDRRNVGLFHHVKTLEMDFSSIEISDDAIELDCNSISLNSYVKSNGKTKYDIPVTDLNPSTFKYNRINTEATISYNPIIPSYMNTTEFDLESIMYLILPVSIGEYVGPADGNKHEFNSCEGSAPFLITKSILDNPGSRNPPIFKAGENVTLRLYSDFTVSFTRTNGLNLPSISVVLGIRSFDNNGNATVTDKFGAYAINGRVRFFPQGEEVYLNEGEELLLYLRIGLFDRVYSTIYMTVEEFVGLYFSYDAIGNPVNIDVVTPENILHSLVGKLTDNKIDFNTSIEWEGEDLNYFPAIVAAESVRGFDDANFHISFDQFREWLDVMGYGMDFPTENSMVFRKYEQFFSDTITLNLSQKENAGLRISVDKEYLYTHIRIGYDKQEYNDNTNGRLEPNGTFEYSTEYISETENSLELISPFRADSIGIELLCQERAEQGKEKKDNRSDNDVFVIALYTVSGSLVLYEPVKFRIENIFYLFNAILSPYHLVKRNAKRIGITGENIYFASTTSNRETIIEGADINLYSDINTPEKYFNPEIYDIACGYKTDLPIIELPNGIVEFVYKRKTYRGYIKDATKNYSREAETTMQLHAID